MRLPTRTRRSANVPNIYAVTVPKGTPWQAGRAQQFMDQMLFTFSTIVLRIVAEADRIEWQVLDLLDYEPGTVVRAIRAVYPDAEVTGRPADVYRLDDRPVHRYVSKYSTFAETFLAPILRVTDIKDSDPLAALVHAMSHLRAGERISYTVAVLDVAANAYKAGQEQITRKIYDGLLSLVFPRKEPRYQPQIQRVLEEKLATRLYRCLVFIQFDTPDAARIPELLVVDSQTVLFDREGFNGLRWYNDGGQPVQVTTNEEDLKNSAVGIVVEFTRTDVSPDIARARSDVGLILEPREIAALWHLPHNGFHDETITWAGKRPVPMPANIARYYQGLRLGSALYLDQAQPVCLPHSLRTSHVSIVGKTRTGKSNLLHHLIHQDIATGLGVTVIDPHGDLVRDLLRTSIPPEREDDVVILDIADTQHPPALNLLATASADKSLTTAGELADILAMVYGDMRDAPRAKNTLTSALATIWQDDHATLLDVTRLFEEPGYRQRLVKQFGVENIRLLQFWRNYENQSDAMQEQISAPVTYRMQALYGNPALLPITCHPNHIDFSQLVAENRIILVSLKVDNKIIPEEDQNLLGAMIVAAFQHSVQARASNRLFSLYVDEAQRFVTTSLPTLFAEAGKRGISVTLANQFYKQLAGETLDAVMGNVGSIIAFRSGMEDARVLASYLKPAFDVDDLVQMENYHAAVWMQQAAFSLTTDPPLPTENEACARREGYLRQHSRERYSPMTRETILKWIQTRYIDGDDQSNQPDDLRYDPDADGKS